MGVVTTQRRVSGCRHVKVTVIDGPSAVRRVTDVCAVRHLLPFEAGP